MGGIKNFNEIKVGDKIFHVRADNHFNFHTRVILVKTILVRRYGCYFSGPVVDAVDGSVVGPDVACFITSSNLSRSVQKSSGFNIHLYCTDESLVSENLNKVIANLIYRHNMHILDLPF